MKLLDSIKRLGAALGFRRASDLVAFLFVAAVFWVYVIQPIYAFLWLVTVGK